VWVRKLTGGNKQCLPVTDVPALAQHHELLPAGRSIRPVKVQRLAVCSWLRQLSHQRIIGPAVAAQDNEGLSVRHDRRHNLLYAALVNNHCQ
jgi:hypothetical protein